MDEGLTYYAALELLGEPGSRLVTLLDTVTTVGLTVWASGALVAGKDVAAPLGILELKNEVVQFGQKVMRRISDWHTGLSRFNRSERLTAAHAVLVVSSYFEALEDADLPIAAEDLSLTGTEQVALTAGGAAPDGYAEVIEFLLREHLPMREPHRTYAEVRSQLRDCYSRLSGRLLKFVTGLAVWDELDATGQDALAEAVRGIPGRAVERYDDAYRQLAADNQEFGVWAGLTGIHAIGAALAGMSTLLEEMSDRQPGRRSRAHLSMSYQAALDDPIIGAGQAPDGVVLPTLAEGYVNPVCRAAETRPGDNPASIEWWESRDLVPDAEVFLAGYLTSARAVRTPLVVLGEPGSGKSKLAEVLAARLPAQDFFPVLVELRDVAAESMILEQIEQAIYQRPGERVSWHDLLEAAHEALPVVLLDGFDELVQATAVNRYDYLEQVREFQRRQAQVGHPVAVIVTSRTVVADQVRFPPGTMALQLQPFSDGQVRHWLEIWNRANASALAARGMRTLPAEIVLTHRELAQQPLLLLLTAIFDAGGNSLQRSAAQIGRAELYERLLIDFAHREISKTARNRALPAARQSQLAAHEVQRLSVVALAMFTRGQQAITEADLNEDLPILFTEDRQDAGQDADLTPAQRATGRFFFIHKSEARQRDDRVRSYEFLHATFAEFLVARLAVTALRDAAHYREFIMHGTTAAGELDDGFLYAALSFSCLASRAPIISFLAELLSRLSADDQARCRDTLGELIDGSLFPHASRSFQHYQPARHPIPRRVAAYSANLVIMLVLLTGKVPVSEFCGKEDAAKKWSQYGYLWRSAFTTSDWRGLVDTLRARPDRRGGPVEIMLTQEDGSPVSPTDFLVITEEAEGHTSFDVYLSAQPGNTFEVSVPSASLAGRIFRELSFVPRWQTAMLLLQDIPFLRAFGGEIRFRLSDDTLALPGYMLADLDYSRDALPDARASLYESYASAFAADSDLREQFLLRLQRETAVLPAGPLIRVLRAVNTLPPSPTFAAVVTEIWHRLEPHGGEEPVVELIKEVQFRWPEVAVAALGGLIDRRAP